MKLKSNISAPLSADQQKVQAIQAIAALGQLKSFDIDGKRFEITKKGRYTITARGSRNAEYIVSFCPNMTVVEDAVLPVFVVSRTGRCIYFTLKNGEAARLHA